jgi:hypothetical protein
LRDIASEGTLTRKEGAVASSLCWKLGVAAVAALLQASMRSDVCDSQLSRNAVGGEAGYKNRRDGPDPYCEGEFKEPVAGFALAKIFLAEYSIGARPATLDDQWVLTWPFFADNVAIRGRHRELATKYQIDGLDTHRGADQESPDRDTFEWAPVRAAASGFEGGDILFSARVVQGDRNSPLLGLPEGTEVFLPLKIEQAKQAASLSASTMLRIQIAANKILHGVRVEASRVGALEDPVVLHEAWSLEPRAKSISLKQLPRDGGLWRIDVSSKEDGLQVSAGCFYVMLPDESFHAWATGR